MAHPSQCACRFTNKCCRCKGSTPWSGMYNGFKFSLFGNHHCRRLWTRCPHERCPRITSHFSFVLSFLSTNILRLTVKNLRIKLRPWYGVVSTHGAVDRSYSGGDLRCHNNAVVGIFICHRRFWTSRVKSHVQSFQISQRVFCCLDSSSLVPRRGPCHPNTARGRVHK